MDLGTFPQVGAYDPGRVGDGAALQRRGFVREIGRQMFATFYPVPPNLERVPPKAERVQDGQASVPRVEERRAKGPRLPVLDLPPLRGGQSSRVRLCQG